MRTAVDDPTMPGQVMGTLANGVWEFGHRLGRVEPGDEWLPATAVWGLALVVEYGWRLVVPWR